MPESENYKPLEILYAASWPPEHYVDIPVDALWIKDREWTDEENDVDDDISSKEEEK